MASPQRNHAMLTRALACTASDLFMAAKTALYLLGEHATTLDIKGVGVLLRGSSGVGYCL